MRKITDIIVHCSAGRQSASARDIVEYHLRPVERGGRGWTVPGYHFIIEADGHVAQTLDINHVANGVKGHNAHSIHVCYIGGVDSSKKSLPPLDNRTSAQRRSMFGLLCDLRRRFPQARISGHRDFAAKACPSFDARKEYASL